MGLLKDWREHAYNLDDRTKEGQMFWQKYFLVEKGTVKDLAEKYGADIETMTGFLDGIDDSLKTSNDLDNITEDSEVSLDIDPEKLYMNMVQCKADWLYELPQWDNIFSVEKRKDLYLKEKKSHTVVKEKKIGRNDPCPCGSGKKYKQCCGKNA